MTLKIGDSELDLLRYIAEHGDCTVREASDHFGETRGWGRTTVLKTVDRLMGKGLLTRSESEGVFRYRSTMTVAELERALVEQFFSRSLGGSLHPLVAYFDGQASVSDAELDELKELVRKLEARKDL